MDLVIENLLNCDRLLVIWEHVNVSEFRWLVEVKILDNMKQLNLTDFSQPLIFWDQ